jgi:hypothetical protein
MMLPPRPALGCIALSLMLGIALVVVIALSMPAPPAAQSPTLDAPVARLRADGGAALYALRADAARAGWTFEAHQRAAALYDSLGDPHAAAAHREAALALRPGDRETVRALAVYAVRAEDWARAVEALDGYLAVAPDDAWANAWLGMLRAPYQPAAALVALDAALARGGGIADFERALLESVRDTLAALPPGDLSAALRVGITLVEQRQWPLAERAFRLAAALGGSDAEALAYLGLARAMQGKPGEAALTRALQLDGLNPQVLFLAALYAQALGDGEAAIRALLEAAALSPDDPAISAALGRALAVNGLVTDAEIWLTYAVEQSGDDPQYAAMLAEFEGEYAGLLDVAGALVATPDLAPTAPGPR